MSQKVIIAREQIELGALTKAEVKELLDAGFLRTTDTWRPEATNEWLPVSALFPEQTQQSLEDVVRHKLATVGKSVASSASQMTSKLRSFTARGRRQLTASTTQLLESFLPQLRRLVASQLIKQPVQSIQSALKNDEFVQKFFGAVYDCLPKPVCRFVAEEAFIQFCMDRRAQLLTPDLEVGQGDLSKMKTVAIIGASNDRAKFGNKAVRAFVQQGYEVFPVNPREETIEGLRAFKSITDVPLRPQMISVYLPPPVLLNVLPDIAAKGCDELWLNPGTESDEVLAEAGRLGLNVIQACSIVGVGVSPSQL
ncbi:MAG TPA: CoA-binding protein [Verrucomicrobiae bacterium]|nr:CoA-binding protein [Verrucomicrobiae bacterium]